MSDKLVELKPEIKAQWLKALRSGDYKQGIGALNCEGEFCCLGVLTDLYDKAVHPNDTRWKLTGMRYSYPNPITSTQTTETLPSDVMDWAFQSINEGNDFVYLPSQQREGVDELQNDYGSPDTLTEINDAGYSFQKIAQIIEDNL